MINSLIKVGTIGAPYGLQGWAKLNSYTSPFTNILLYQPWHLLDPYTGKVFSTVKFTASREANNKLWVKLEHCETPEMVKKFTGKEIAVFRAQLIPLSNEEYYWVDLEGLEVFNEEGEFLGIVDHLFETGANDVLVVLGKKKHLIPFNRQEIIKKIDLVEGKITVNWKEDF